MRQWLRCSLDRSIPYSFHSNPLAPHRDFCCCFCCCWFFVLGLSPSLRCPPRLLEKPDSSCTKLCFPSCSCVYMCQYRYTTLRLYYVHVSCIAQLGLIYIYCAYTMCIHILTVLLRVPNVVFIEISISHAGGSFLRRINLTFQRVSLCVCHKIFKDRYLIVWWILQGFNLPSVSTQRGLNGKPYLRIDAKYTCGPVWANINICVCAGSFGGQYIWKEAAVLRHTSGVIRCILRSVRTMPSMAQGICRTKDQIFQIISPDVTITVAVRWIFPFLLPSRFLSAPSFCLS